MRFQPFTAATLAIAVLTLCSLCTADTEKGKAIAESIEHAFEQAFEWIPEIFGGEARKVRTRQSNTPAPAGVPQYAYDICLGQLEGIAEQGQQVHVSSPSNDGMSSPTL